MISKQTYIAIGILTVLAIIIVILYLRGQKYKNNGSENGVITTPDPYGGMFDFGYLGTPVTPAMYGNDPVVKGADGIWRLAPGTCVIDTTGIIDWPKIQALPPYEKEQMITAIDNCQGQMVPLIQP